MRVSEKDKADIQAFARAAGLGVTDFMLRSAMRCGSNRAFRYPEQQTLAVAPDEFPLGSLSAFWSACSRAKKGGTGGYAEAGKALYAYALKKNTGCTRATDELVELVGVDDTDGILDWFDAALPFPMQSVPARRRSPFVVGVQALHKTLCPWEAHG